MIYKYNVAFVRNNISKELFSEIKQKTERIRNSAAQDIVLGFNHTVFVTEQIEPFNFNTYIICGKIKTFYAICAIRTDENYINQWLILKNPISGYKKIYLSKTEVANTDLYRRMTINEIKAYFNDCKYDV